MALFQLLVKIHSNVRKRLLFVGLSFLFVACWVGHHWSDLFVCGEKQYFL